jgi:AraC-like DNA-binding protein
MGIEVVEFSSDEPDLAYAMRCIDAGDVGADRITHTMSARVVWQPAGLFLTGTVVSGAFDDLAVSGRNVRVGPADTVLAGGLQTELTASWTHVVFDTLRIPRDAVDRVARERAAGPARARFIGVRPVSGGAGRRWGALCAFVHQELDVPDSPLAEPLVQAALTEVIATAALVTFENSAMTADGLPRRTIAVPASVRRAQSYIEGHAQLPLTLTDIAVASGVTPRALRHGFARHLESSPMGYVRTVRLRRIHQELQAAAADQTTVVQVARRWGFANQSRFDHRYHAAFGRSPARTLAR